MNLPSPGSPAQPRFRSGGVPPTGPNNVGPTLLISLGLMSAPIGLGIPLVLLGLARLRTAQGTSAFPLLAAALESVHLHLQAWAIR